MHKILILKEIFMLLLACRVTGVVSTKL